MSVSANIDYKGLYEAAQLEVLQLKQQLQQLKKMIFGSRHERYVPSDPNSPQLQLAIQVEPIAACHISSAQKISFIRNAASEEPRQIQHPGRSPLPEHLRREQIIIDPDADITGCRKIGEEITEVLEYQPGELYVKQYRRVKYIDPAKNAVLIGSLPARAIDKAIAGEGLLAQVAIDKYVDHLPLYRQMQRFDRAGVKLPYSTLTDWVAATCKLITPLFDALKAEVLSCGYLQVDETPIRVLDRDKNGETHRGYYWVYHNPIDKVVFFDYQPGRGRQGPMEILQNFQGYLQSDGYSAYDIFDKRERIRLLHCMAHARRMFHDALGNDKAVAEYAMSEMQKLYAIERICKERNLSFDEIKTKRQSEAAPILASLGQWMKEQYIQASPRSMIGKALAYSIERWEKLSRYTEDGKLRIDNNLVENSIRPVALGKKNYLFSGSHEAARRSGMLYSLLGTCKMHSIEPYNWLKDVLQRINAHPINQIKDLLPYHYKL